MSNDLKTYLRNIRSLDPDKRKAAVNGLADSDSIEALAALEKTAREDTNIEVRFQAENALQSLKQAMSNNSDSITDEAPSTTTKSETAINEDKNTRKTDSKDTNAPKEKGVGKPPNDSDTAKIRKIKALTANNSPETVPALVKLLKTEDSSAVRGTILLAIGLLGGTKYLQLFARYLGDDEPSVRLNCVKALTYMDDKMSYPLFVVALNDKNAQVASRSYGFIRKLGKDNIIGLLQKMAVSEKGWMKRAAAKACGKFSTPEVMKILKQLASDNSENIKSCALKSMKSITSRKSKTDKVEKTLKKDIQAMKRSMVENEILRSDKSVGFIVTTDEDSPIHNENREIRLQTLEEIINEGDSDRLPEVLNQLPLEKDLKLKAIILTVIGRLGSDTDLPHIVEYLRHKDPRIRATAVEMTGLLQPENIGELLSPFLEDEDNRTAANTIVALKDIKNIDLTGALKRLAESKEINYRKSCIYAITQLNDNRGIKLLNKLKSDENSEVAAQATQAIAILDQNKKTKKRPEKVSKKPVPIMPSQFDLNKTDYRHVELSPVDILYPCYYAYAMASISAISLIAMIAISNNSQTVFYIQMIIAFVISIEYVAAAVSLQSGKEWARQFLLFTTKIIRIPMLAPKSAKILKHEDTLDLFGTDKASEHAGKVVIAVTLVLTLLFAGLLFI